MIKLYCDCADLETIKKMSTNPLIKGFTTNPTLLKKAGVTNYRKFIEESSTFLQTNRPDTSISYEIFTDDSTEILEQAKAIRSASKLYLTYVKVPSVNTYGSSNLLVAADLLKIGIPVNFTAVFTNNQTLDAFSLMSAYNTPSIISIFAGRLYDIGVNATEYISYETKKFKRMKLHNVEVLWASPRQSYDYINAQSAGCDIITMTPELIEKLKLFETTPFNYCIDTVKMFYEDGKATGFNL